MNPKFTPVPTGFAEIAPFHTIHALRKRYKIGYSTVTRWCAECGVAPRTAERRAPRKSYKIPTPPDLAERAAHSSNAHLRTVYGVSHSTVSRWLRESGIETDRKFARPHAKPKLRAVPDDFADMARRYTRNQLRSLYRVSEGLITRWIIACGVEPKVPTSARTNGQRRQFSTPSLSGAITDQAAQYLRRRHSNVFRADILPEDERKRLPNKGRGYYVISGKGAVPANDMVALAQSEGFNPRAWAAL